MISPPEPLVKIQKKLHKLFHSTEQNDPKVANHRNIFLNNISLSTDPNLKYLCGPRSAVGNVSGYRCVSDCRSRGREFDPGPVPYFRGD